MLLAAGCSSGDRVCYYHLTGTLVDAHTGRPVSGAKIVGSVFPARDPSGEQWRYDHVVSGPDGGFDATVGQLRGGVYPISLLIAPEDAPVNEVAVYVDINHACRKIVIPVGQARQPRSTDKDRWIDLGKVFFDPRSPAITTAPAK
jgi:hypothetical protein